MVKQISDNELYLLIKYIKSVLLRGAKCLSYIEEARCLKFNSAVMVLVVAEIFKKTLVPSNIEHFGSAKRYVGHKT